MNAFRRINPFFQTSLRPISYTKSQTTFFSTTAPLLKRRRNPQQKDRRIGLIRQHLWHPQTPRVLRLSRHRSLRHWTIARAWTIFTKGRADKRERELERQWNAMRAACERLRTLGDDGVEGGENVGRMLREAMVKTDVWDGVPIEYARCLTDWPAREGWNHDWKRGDR